MLRYFNLLADQYPSVAARGTRVHKSCLVDWTEWLWPKGPNFLFTLTIQRVFQVHERGKGSRCRRACCLQCAEEKQCAFHPKYVATFVCLQKVASEVTSALHQVRGVSGICGVCHLDHGRISFRTFGIARLRKIHVAADSVNRK